MPDQSKKITQLPACTTPIGTDLIVGVSNVSGNATTCKIELKNLVFRYAATPANSTITIQQGTSFHDNNYGYIAVANNVLKRFALSSF